MIRTTVVVALGLISLSSGFSLAESQQNKPATKTQQQILSSLTPQQQAMPREATVDHQANKSVR